ncbi:MAG: rhomboid family intramembrane serine protease [Planctomycetaceae bacterium]
MRHIGTLSDLREAQTFEDYLLTRGVKAKLETDDNQWAVWVFDEDDVDTARTELAEFRTNPGDARYAESGKAAADLREQAVKQAIQARKNVVDVRRRWSRPLSARAPVTFAMIIVSVSVAVGSRLGADYEPFLKALSFTSVDNQGRYYPFRSEQNDIRRGQIWRLVTPIFIHYTFLHILFNMMWLRDLGSAIEIRRGSVRYLALVLTIAVASNVAQYWYSDPAFGGMSGVVYGLFGYIWVKGRFEPEAGLFMPPNLVLWMMAWFVLCFTGWVGPIANMAHGMGLLAGVVIAYAPIAWRDLMRG